MFSALMKLVRASLRQPLFALLSLAMPAAAADHWELIVKDRERQVEIDRSTVIQSDNGAKVAWARIVLSPERAATEGYAAVKALNRFDCYNRSFFTVKRVYLDSRHLVLREEGVLDQSPVLAARNSVDERLWQEVCRPPSVGDLQKVAQQAAAVTEQRQPESPPVAASRAAPASAAPAPTDAIAAIAESMPDSTPAASTTRASSSRAASMSRALPSPAASASGASPSPAAASAHSERPGGSPRSAAIVAAAGPVAQWSYDGDTGPEQWGRLRPEWNLCADGRQQSPIDVAGGIAVDLDPPRFDYRPTHFRITDTGRTLQVDVGEGMGVEIRGQRYELEHLQFHRPSVERVGGQASAMTVHFHHRAANGRIAIVAVLFERGEAAHPLVQTLWNSLPLERGGHYMPASATIEPATLIPADPSHYLYLGSLVTPPCTEGVTWVVMKSKLTLSDDQLAIFARLYPRNGRPLQPRNGRIVLESR
ncbi:carbonic anhydrase [Aromatoleum sp.]|uniref:carbonic anhydrase n=1 Tax=Aromatoleum sp. TaxID=2307007 RepID=UPI002FC88241